MNTDMDIVRLFEEKVADYAGCRYGIAISSGTNAIFLSLLYLKSIGKLNDRDIITLPKQTYMSVPMTILNLNLKIEFEESHWSGCYQIKPTNVYDSAVRFTKDMYIPGSLQCLSFQYRKHLPIGRGGMILTDSKDAYDWLISARFNGRTPGTTQKEDVFKIQGWNMYMIPEQAAKGLTLLNIIPDKNRDCRTWSDYPDLSNQEIFK